MTEDKKSMESSRKVIARTVIGATIIGAIGSGIWDLVGKRIMRFILYIIAYFFESVRDFSYSSAGTFPNGTFSLLVFQHMISVVFLVAIFMLFNEFTIPMNKKYNYRLYLRSKISNKIKIYNKTKSFRNLYLITFRRKIVVRNATLFILFGLYWLLLSQVLMQTMEIYNTFSRNLIICSPYLSELDKNKFQAKFVMMKNQNDYILIDNELKKVANDNKVNLENANLW